MYKKTKYFFISFGFILSILSIVIVYLINTKSSTLETKKDKNTFVSVVGLPDLAISTESSYIRHRSLTSIQTIFSDAPEYIEYLPSSFIISYGVQNEK